MLLQLELYRLQLSPYRPPRPLPWPSAEEIELIRELGFVEPITARPLPRTDPPQYEIVAGEKHWLAAQKAGLAKIPVLVLNAIDEDTAQRLQALQAIGVRNDPIQEARALQRQIQRGATVTHAGSVAGHSRTMASHLLRLLRLDPAVQQLITQGQLSVGHAKVLVGLAPAVQWRLVNQIRSQDLTVRQTEALVRQIRQSQRYPATVPVKASRTAARAKNADAARLEMDLSALLGSPVSVDCNDYGSGQLTITFSDLDVLDGILSRLGYQRDLD